MAIIKIGKMGWEIGFQGKDLQNDFFICQLFQIMSRNSIEGKLLYQDRKLNKSRYNPESSTNIIPTSTPVPQKGLKRCQSATTIRNKSNRGQFQSIELKYRLLEQNYQNLFQQTIAKAETFKKHKKEMEQLQKLHDLHQQQIKVLKGRLGFLIKKDQATQADFRPSCVQTTKANVSHFRTNDEWSKKSTFREKKIANTFYREREHGRNRGEEQSRKSHKKPPSQSRIKENLSHYKFVPTLPLK